MYTLTEAGMEKEYFNIILNNVKITSITADLYPGASTGTHLETILLRYESITWKHAMEISSIRMPGINALWRNTFAIPHRAALAALR